MSPPKEGLGMFCPKCRCEFVDGITRCADCDEQLVLELSNPPKEQETEYQELMMTADFGHIAFIKSLLSGNGIEYVVQGEQFVSLAGIPGMPVRFFVRADQMQEARDIIGNGNLAASNDDTAATSGDANETNKPREHLSSCPKCDCPTEPDSNFCDQCGEPLKG